MGSVAVSFPVLLSPPPETVAELVTLEGALFATFTVKVIAGKLPLAARALLRVQVSVPKLQVQPVPARPVGMSPAGRLSTTVTVPLLGPPPGALLTVIV